MRDWVEGRSLIRHWVLIQVEGFCLHQTQYSLETSSSPFPYTDNREEGSKHKHQHNSITSLHPYSGLYLDLKHIFQGSIIWANGMFIRGAWCIDYAVAGYTFALDDCPIHQGLKLGSGSFGTSQPLTVVLWPLHHPYCAPCHTCIPWAAVSVSCGNTWAFQSPGPSSRSVSPWCVPVGFGLAASPVRCSPSPPDSRGAAGTWGQGRLPPSSGSLLGLFPPFSCSHCLSPTIFWQLGLREHTPPFRQHPSITLILSSSQIAQGSWQLLGSQWVVTMT